MEFGRAEEPTAAIIDSRTLRSAPEGGTLAGYDGVKRKRGSMVHVVFDTLGHLLALHVTPPISATGLPSSASPDIQEVTGAESSWPTATRAIRRNSRRCAAA